MCCTILVEEFGGKLFKLCCSVSEKKSFSHPTPLCFHAFVATLSIMLAIGLCFKGSQGYISNESLIEAFWGKVISRLIIRYWKTRDWKIRD